MTEKVTRAASAAQCDPDSQLKLPPIKLGDDGTRPKPSMPQLTLARRCTTAEDLERYFEQSDFSPSLRKLVVNALRGDPVRRVGSARGNTAVRFVSKKMNRVIQAESRLVELAFCYRSEFDETVRLYLCQPYSLRIRVTDRLGRVRSTRYVPDYLVLDDLGLALVECKTEAELENQLEHPHPRYVRNKAGNWTCPAAVFACAKEGLAHRVFTSEDVNPVWIRNVKFLSDFLGQLGTGLCLQEIKDYLALEGSVHLGTLLSKFEAAAVWTAIAKSFVYVDLERFVVGDPECVEQGIWVHATEARARLHAVSPATPPTRPLVTSLTSGSSIQWHGVRWAVVNAGSDRLTLREPDSRRLEEVLLSDVERLLSDGAIRADESEETKQQRMNRKALFKGASDAALAAADERYEAYVHWKTHGKGPEGVSPTTIWRIRQYAAEGEAAFGDASCGMIRQRGRKRGTRDLEAAQLKLLNEAVEKLEKKKPGKLRKAYQKMVSKCVELVPARKWPKGLKAIGFLAGSGGEDSGREVV